jgi:hypothetical protein
LLPTANGDVFLKHPNQSISNGFHKEKPIWLFLGRGDFGQALFNFLEDELA